MSEGPPGSPIDAPPQPASSFGRRAAAQLVLGLLAGGLVCTIEAVDRIVLLRYNLDGIASNAALGALTAAGILFAATIAIVFGLFFTVLDGVRSAIHSRLGAVSERWRWLVALLMAAAMGSVVLRLLSWLRPTVVEGPVYRLINRFDRRLSNLGLIADHPKIVFIVLVCGATVALMAFHAWLFSRRGPRARLLALPFAIVSIVAVVAMYWVDSRIEFTRYEHMLHIPLEIIFSVVALVAMTAAARTFGDPSEVATARAPAIAAILLASAGLGSLAYGAVAMDAIQETKTFFWSRSVVARRVFQFARQLGDDDGDGFADTFGGADLDDANPEVNPLAAEIPGNGIDDNCIGGDLKESTFPLGSLYPGAVPSTPVGAAEKKSVILISIDCLRADHMSLYGYSRPTTPNIDALAAESLVFDYCIPQGTNTGHSFTSLFRSSYGNDIFDDRVPALLRLLRDSGYQTTLLNTVRTDIWLNAARWDKYRVMMEDIEPVHNDGPRYWTAEELTNRALEHFESLKGPNFTWIHYFDAHRQRAFHKEHDFGRSDKNRYDGNIQYIDAQLARLIARLRETGELDRSIVVITADHGEAFGEHGAWEHSNKPYNNNAHVPLVIRAPGVPAARFREPVALVDVSPTILAYLGLPSQPFHRGIDLVATTRAGEPQRRQLVSETPRNLIESPFYSWAIVEWPYKGMWDLRSNTFEVFDLSNDYDEQNDLADKDPVLAARMRATLGSWLDRETARTGSIGSEPAEEDGE